MDPFISLSNLERLEYLENLENRRKNITHKRSCHFTNLDDADFHRRYRLTKNSVKALLPLIENKIQHGTHLNNALSPLEQLLIALRYYATGTFQLVIGDLIKVSQPTVCRAIHRVSSAIASLRPDFVRMPETQEECSKASEDFFNIAQFPNVIGVIGCTQIPILSPGGDNAEQFRNSEGFFSIKTQIVVSADLSITNVVARWPGSTSDNIVYTKSRLFQSMQNSVQKDYHLVGGSEYLCHSTLMTPLSKPITEAEQRYNNAHALTKNTVDESYRILKKRFPCLDTKLKCKVESVLGIIVACCVLHNLALKLGDPEPELDPEVKTYIEGVTKRKLIIQQFS